jgi:hypothetical protein
MYFDGGGAASAIGLGSGDINFYTFDGGGGSADAQWSFTSRMHIKENGYVGIGETTPLGFLHVKSADSGASVDGGADELVVEASSTGGMSILSGTSSSGFICFGDSGDNNIGKIVYDHSDDSMSFTTNAAEAMRIHSDGDIGLGGATTAGFVVETGNTTNANKAMGNILSTSTDVFQFRREDFNNYIEVTLSGYLGYRKEVFRAYQSVATTATKIYGTDSMVGSMVNVSGTTWKYVITTSGNGYSTSVNLFFNGAKDSYVWL